jgi:hypothetical protein
MKPTCITYTNTNEYNIQTCGFHQTFKKLYSDENCQKTFLNIFPPFYLNVFKKPILFE